MANLTDTAYKTRQLIKYGSIAIVVFIILRIGFSIFKQWWEVSHPPPPPPATVSFGKLPEPPFPDKEKPDLTFRLETVTGEIGEFDNLATVYLMPVKPASLLALERANSLAQKMGFLFDPISITDTLYEWTKDEPIPSTLRLDTITDHFIYEVNWRVRPDLLSLARAPSEAESISLARSWLAGIGKLPEDLAAGEADVSYLKVSGTEIIPALSQSDAQLVNVSLTRAPIEEMKVWPSDPDEGIVNITFIPSRAQGSRGNLQVIEARYEYVPAEYEQNATYPLISAEEAWEELLKGQEFYAEYPEEVQEIAIRRISLGYFDPPLAGYFLQPIFVFEGDDFTAYVPAVLPEWIEQTE